MLLSPKNGLDSLFKEVRVFKVSQILFSQPISDGAKIPKGPNLEKKNRALRTQRLKEV